MTSRARAPDRPVAVVGETKKFGVDCTNILEDGELLTGTPTVAEETTSDLSISEEQVNVAAVTLNGESVAIGKAVLFYASGFLKASAPYTIKITATTDAAVPQTLVRYVEFDVYDA